MGTYLLSFCDFISFFQARDERFRSKEDFAIVLQNFTKELTFPLQRDSAGKFVCDLTYLSQDCFHFSQKGYARGLLASSHTYHSWVYLRGD